MRLTRLVLAAVAVVGVAAGGVVLASRALSDPRPSFHGVRLGMTADELRARVDEHGEGTWSASATSGDWILEHTSGHELARFELHDGQLMAIRVDTIATPDLTGATLEVTDSTVLHRDARDERIVWTLLSRACPTHRAEAEALVRAGSGSDR